MTKWDVMRAKDLKKAHGVDEAVIRKLLQQGKLEPNDCLRKSGTEPWTRVAEIREQFFVSDDDAVTRSVRQEAMLPETRLADATRPRKTLAETYASLENEDDDESSRDDLTESQRNLHVKKKDEDHEEDAGFARRSLDVEEFDLTPMVDMTFLLNMFFMLTTSYVLLRSIDLPAPNLQKSDAKGAKQSMTLEDVREDYIIAVIAPDNTVTIDETEVPKGEYVAAFKNRMIESGKSALIVQAADEAYHETVVAVLDAGNEAGMQKVQLATTLEALGR